MFALLLLFQLTCLPACTDKRMYVDSRIIGSVHNGAGWSTAYPTIAEALTALGNGGEIWVRAGSYHERLVLNQYTTIYGGFLGFESSPDQRIVGAFPTVIGADRAGRAVAIPTSARVTMDGLTIRDGLADCGGGIRCGTNSIVNIRSCRIVNCEATARGGGLYYDTYTQGTAENCVIACNMAPYGAGAVVEYHSYPTLTGCVIARNAASGSGGGLACPFHSGALLINCTIAHNSAGLNGGGIYAYYGGPETFRQCIVAFNQAPVGAGLYADGGPSSATLTSCDWYGNSFGDLGGWLTALPPGNTTADPGFLAPSSDDYHLVPSSPCAGMGAFPSILSYQIDRIGVAKTLPDNTPVSLSGKIVCAVDGDLTYLEEPDRIAAISVTGLAGCSRGQVVSLTGALGTVGGERILHATNCCVCPGVSYPLEPLALPLSCLSARHGILACTWGRVSALSADGFILTSGGASVDVLWRGVCPAIGTSVAITGVPGMDRSFITQSLLWVSTER